MANHRQTTDDHVAEYHAREPSIPESHDSIELTTDTVILYDREDSRQWIWADEVVHRSDIR